MEIHVIKQAGQKIVVLLDDEMRIVKPVYDFMKFLRQNDKALNTLKAYARDLSIFWEWLNKISCCEYDEVSTRLLGDFIDYLRRGDQDILALNMESVRDGKTINRILGTVRRFYEHCANMLEKDEPILKNKTNRPFYMYKSFLHHAKNDNSTWRSIFKVKENNYRVRLVKDDEMETILNELTKKRDYLLYKTLYLTGARIQEVLDLEIEIVPIPDNTKEIGVFQNIKSKGKCRDLYVPMSLIEEIDNFIFEERNLIETDHSYIFVSKQPQWYGKQLTYRAAYDKLRDVQEKIGINFNFHDLRHTFCSALIKSEMDISVVQLIMGHAHISTTQKYTHLDDRYIKKALTNYWRKSSLVGVIS